VDLTADDDDDNSVDDDMLRELAPKKSRSSSQSTLVSIELKACLRTSDVLSHKSGFLLI